MHSYLKSKGSLLRTLRMKCVHFQLQSSSGGYKVKEFLQRVDPRAPMPQPLEGGDGNGGLWECILDAKKVDALIESLTDTVRLYTRLYPLSSEVDTDMYLPSNQVVWRFGKDPVIEKVEILHKQDKDRSDSCVIC